MRHGWRAVVARDTIRKDVHVPERRYLFDRSGLLVINRSGDNPSSLIFRIVRSSNQVSLDEIYIDELITALREWQVNPNV